jgi:hypothetical protein
MTNSYHTPINLNAPANSATINSPLGQLDAAILQLFTGGPYFSFKFDNSNTYQINSGSIGINGDLFIYVQSESGSSDDLHTINDTVNNHILFLKPNLGETITLTDTGNILNTPVELTDSQVAMLVYVDTVWHIIGINGDSGGGGGTPYTPSIAILRDEKSSGTNGGSSAASTWNNRTINTEVSDIKNIVTLASNQFTPIAGTYKIDVSAATHGGGGVHKLRLYNVTQDAVVAYGLNGRGPTQSQAYPTTLKTIFTANGTDAYRIDHYTNAAVANTGLGFPTSITGVNEVYLELILEKID